MAGARPERRLGASGLARRLLLALLIAVPATMGGSPRADALACPRSATVWLRGKAPPGTGLLVRFAGVAVGGGSTRADGAWAIPLTIQERPGIYPVIVAGRQDGTVITTFTCYVDVPVGATITVTALARPSGTAVLTPSDGPAAPTNLPAPTPSNNPLAPTQPLSPTPAPPEHNAPSATTTPSETPPPFETATSAPSASSSPPPPTETPPATSDELALVAVQPDDPHEPGLFEYVIVENRSPADQSLGGWRLVHREMGEAYTIPPLTLPPGDVLVIWSGDGPDDPAGGSLYWPTPGGRWAPGQTVELYRPDGRLTGSLSVPVSGALAS